MKRLTQSVAAMALLGTLTLGMSMDIDAQLEAISTASESDRVELVNDLKVELQSMTPEDRQEVISAVRAEIGVQDGTGEGSGEMIRTQMRQRSQNANSNTVDLSVQRRADTSMSLNAGAMSGEGSRRR